MANVPHGPSMCTCPLSMCVPVPILPSFLYVYLLPPFFVDTCVYLPLRPFYGCTCPPGSPHPLKLCVYLVTPSLCMLKILFVIRGELMPWFWNLIDFHPSILITAGLIGLRQICKLSLFFTGK